MPQLNVQIVNSLPVKPKPSTIYYTVDSDDPTKLITGVSSRTGNGLVSSYSKAEMTDIVNKLLDERVGISRTVRTHTLLNVGDTCNVVLDDRIVINYEKTTNGGYEGYKVEILSVDVPVHIAFRRDTIYDDTSLKGANSNSITLSPTVPYVSDSLTYGSMRDYTRKIIVDLETDISYKVEVFGFGLSKLRFVIERQKDNVEPEYLAPVDA